MPQPEIITVRCLNCETYFTVSRHASEPEKSVCPKCRDYAGRGNPRYGFVAAISTLLVFLVAGVV